ncbi:unnamed protein product [Linum trigynum]|uniref:Uncharacterized protein n=1 Tax=Linum trigynum TaxID=586398 RepID=A0AAV2GJM2_9ROSI
MRGALSSLIEISLWLGERLLQICSVIFAASLRNQKLDGDRGLSKPGKSDRLGFNQSKRCLMRSLVREAAPRAWSRAKYPRRRKRSAEMVFADVQAEEEQPTKRRRAEPRRLWRFRIPSPAEFDLEDSEALTAAEMEIERPLGHDRTNKRFSTAGPFGVGIALISQELVKNESSAPGCSVESEVICGEGEDQGDPFGEGCCAIQQVKSKVDLNSTKPSLNVADLEGFSQLDGAAGD